MIEFREPARTGFELSWRMFGVHFRVLPSFFVVYALITGLFAWPALNNNLLALGLAIALNVGCVFVAILFVSFVQGLVYRSYGLRATVVIREFFSGIYPEAEPPTALQRIVVALSNAGASFLLLALVVYSNQQFQWSRASAVAEIVYRLLYLISWFWAIIGLIPIYPYPGGQVMLEILSLLSPRRGLVMTLVVSIFVGVVYVAYTAMVYLGRMREIPLWGREVLPASVIVAVFFALSVMQNWQLLQLLRARDRAYKTDADAYDDRSPWER